MANIGKISQIIGPVVDVSFEGESASLPEILAAYRDWETYDDLLSQCVYS